MERLYRVHGNNMSVSKMNDLLIVEKKIIREMLRGMNIDFSETELEIHINYFKRNIGFFRDQTHFRELENWLIKLYEGVITGEQV